MERTAKTDQTVQMHRLISVFAWHTGHFVGFVVLRLKYCRRVTGSNQRPVYRKVSRLSIAQQLSLTVTNTIIYTVNLFILEAINFRVLPMECQFAAINFRVSLSYLISFTGRIKFLQWFIFTRIFCLMNIARINCS